MNPSNTGLFALNPNVVGALKEMGVLKKTPPLPPDVVCWPIHNPWYREKILENGIILRHYTLGDWGPTPSKRLSKSPPLDWNKISRDPGLLLLDVVLHPNEPWDWRYIVQNQLANDPRGKRIRSCGMAIDGNPWLPGDKFCEWLMDHSFIQAFYFPYVSERTHGNR